MRLRSHPEPKWWSGHTAHCGPPFCFARARTSHDFFGELRRWSDALSELEEAPNGVAALAMIVSYILQVTDTPPERLLLSWQRG